MTRYILARVLWLIPVLLGVSLIVFGIMKMVPGDVAQVLVGTEGTAEDVENIRHALGLDQPVYVQYGLFLAHLVQGDLGRSAVTRRPVAAEIASRVRPTAELAVLAFGIAVLLGVGTGVVSATH